MKVMLDRKPKVLHVVKDSVHSVSVVDAFERDGRFVNSCLLISKSSNVEFFKDTMKTTILWRKDDMKHFLKNEVYDILLFHSMDAPFYKLFDFIPIDKIVIWWQWGYDIYSNLYGLGPLLPIKLYKPSTQRIVDSIKLSIVLLLEDIVKYLLFYRKYKKLRKKMLYRTDYYQPVIPVEYQLMKRNIGFHAQEFYSPDCFPYGNCNIEIKCNNGNIIIGNSATAENNHIDVWSDIQRYIPKGTKIYIPISYGEPKYTSYLLKFFSNLQGVVLLRDFLPKEDYLQLLDSCSYAVFGVLRQQAMGNIYYCISRGIKVFLYKDSVVYKFLTDSGYCVFPIEDIDENSFKTPLTSLQINQNKLAFEREKRYRDVARDKAINEILEKN